MFPLSSCRSIRSPWPGIRSGALVVCAAVPVVLAVAPGPTSVLAQRAADRERSLYVSVVDGNGVPVRDLMPTDVVVREDGAAREVLRLDRVTTPIEVTVLVDTSDLARPVVSDVRRALTEFTMELGKGHTLALTAVGGAPRVLQGHTATGNAKAFEAGIGRIFPERGTGAYLLEGLMSVIKGVTMRAPERAEVLALLVRAAPEFSEIAHDRVVAALTESGARFDAITVQTGAGEPPPFGGELGTAIHERDLVLDEGTRATGGRNDTALSGLAIAPLLKSLAAELNSQYRLVYARPDSLIPPEKIEVSVKRPGLTSRATPAKVKQ